MSITTVKVLRTISKIVLLIVGIGIIGYGGLMVYKSVVNKPQKVRVTNVTDSAATITWVTDNPVRGVIYYRDEGSFLPGPLGLVGSKVAYDDRDFARAQDECVKAFNENAKNTKDANFTVDGSTFDCENIPVEKLGAYYTHSVTIKNLNDSGTYFFVVGNGIWSWSVGGVSKDISENDLAVANSFNFKTSQLLEEVPTPNIAYGTVYAGVKSVEGYLSESLSKDSLVFAYLTIGGINSQTISAVTNIDGGWTFDKSNFRDTEGNLIADLSKAKMMVRAQYEDVEEARWIEIAEDLDGDTELNLQGNLVDDLKTEEKGNIFEKLEMLMGGIYAADDNTGAYDMGRCEGGGIDNCDDLNCVQKCPISGTNDFSWVETGAKCLAPAFCGCTPGTCRKVSCDTHQECMDNHSWSGTRQGSCGSSSCSSENGDEEEENSSPCDHNDDCESGNCSGGYCTGGGSGDTNRKKPGDTCTYNANREECVQGSGGQALICTWNNKYQISLPGYCTGGGGGENTGYCAGGKENGHQVGVCLGGTKCTTEGGEPKPSDDCRVKCTVETDYGNVSSCGSPRLRGCTLYCGDQSSKISDLICMREYGAKLFYDSCPGDEDVVVPVGPIKVTVTEINLQVLSQQNLNLLSTDPSFSNYFVSEIREVENGFDDGSLCVNRLTEKTREDLHEKLCKSLGGVIKPSAKATNDCNDKPLQVCDLTKGADKSGNSLTFKSYAQDSASDGYTLYLPEYGMYSFQLGDYELRTNTTDGDTYYAFYIETNDKKGFQMPADPDSPTEKEDIMLKSSSAAITYEKVSSAQSYTLVKGINLVSFNFVPVSTDLGPLTAKGVIDEATKKGVTIQYISSFDGGRWSKGYTCKNDKCSGNDFNILPGKGYLVYATKGGEMTIPGYNLKTSVPVNISGGWNLVGIHGYTTAYTARTLIDSMSKIDGVTANNVTWWPTSKGMYEGLQVTGEQQYGFDFPISPTNGYFVRISSFKPEDKKCKSLLWNEGGTLNGSCGIIK